jgi:hypothetical protein
MYSASAVSIELDLYHLGGLTVVRRERQNDCGLFQ